MCACARGLEASEAQHVAAAIRSVLSGARKQFSTEYTCDSAITHRWFLLTVTPLTDDRLNGAVVMHIDVTAQRQAEESLHVSESRFRQMAQSISDVFFLQNLDSSQIYYVSPAYEQVWGRTCESLYAHPASWADSIYPDDRQRAYREFSASQNTGFDYEFRIVRPDGEIRWLHVRGFPIFDAAGVAYRTAGVATDITQRMQTDMDLRENERRFGDLLRNVDLASVMLDHEARVTFCNDYLLRLTDRRHEEVIGRNAETQGGG